MLRSAIAGLLPNTAFPPISTGWITVDQLVLTGELNDVGSALRANVDKSFRRGIELQLGLSAESGVKSKRQWGF